MNCLLATLSGLVLAATASAGDSVVVGHGVSNAFLSKVQCPAEEICLDGRYVWVLSATRTVAGPPVHGQVRAVSIQHVDAIPEFVRSVELFVLRPIEDPGLRISSGANFYIISLSPRDSDGRYCLSVEPKTLGLRLGPTDVQVHDDQYCFAAKLL